MNGISNTFSEELSYVDDVMLTNFSGTGLMLGVYPTQNGHRASAVNSGPYSRISYSGSGICAQIVGQVTNTRGTVSLGLSTRGIHGLTCQTTDNTGILLDGSNNSLEDISITHLGTPNPTTDGILVGSQSSAQNNLLANIIGTSLTSVIHITNTATFPLYNCATNVCDLTVLGVSNGGSSTNTIKDELTLTTITDSTVGMYVVGEQVISGTHPAYSRFNTTPGFTSWLVGGSAPSGNCATGTLFSCTGSTNNCTNPQAQATIWGCAGGAWAKIK